MGLQNTKMQNQNYPLHQLPISQSEMVQQRKRYRNEVQDLSEQPIKRSNSAPVEVSDQYQYKLMEGDRVDNISIFESVKYENNISNVKPTNIDYSMFWTEDNKFILINAILEKLKDREIPVNILPKLPPLAKELSQPIMIAFPPDPGLYQPAIISKVVTSLQQGKRGKNLREDLYHGYYPTSTDVMNVINRISTSNLANRQAAVTALATMYRKYPYLQNLITESVDFFIRQEIDKLKYSQDPIGTPLDCCSELIRMLATDLKLYKDQLVITILSLVYVDYKMNFFRSICFYLKDAVRHIPKYAGTIIQHILKRFTKFSSAVQIMAIDIVFFFYLD